MGGKTEDEIGNEPSNQGMFLCFEGFSRLISKSAAKQTA